MKKALKIKNLDCANCASKIEDAVSKIDGVTKASVNFILQKMTLELDDNNQENLLKEINKICKKIEPDCEIEF